MAEDQPSQQAPKIPPDPFSPAHMGHVAVLEMFRGLRRAGAGMVEAAIIVGGIIATAGAAGQNEGEHG